MPRNSVKHSKSPTMSNIFVGFHHINFQPLWWSKFHVSDLGRPAEVSRPPLFSAMSLMGIPQFREAWWNSLKLRPKLEGTIWFHLFKLWRSGNPWISKLSRLVLLCQISPAGKKVGWQTRCGMMLIFCQHWFMLKWSELRWSWCVCLLNPQHQWTAGDEVLAEPRTSGIPSFATMCKWITSKFVHVFPLSFNLHVARGTYCHTMPEPNIQKSNTMQQSGKASKSEVIVPSRFSALLPC